MLEEIKAKIRQKIDSKIAQIENRFSREPIKTSVLLIVVLAGMILMGMFVLQALGFLKLLAYFCICLWSLNRMLNKPERAINWAIGFIIMGVFSIAIKDVVIQVFKEQSGTNLVVMLGLVVLIFVKFRNNVKKKLMK